MWWCTKEWIKIPDTNKKYARCPDCNKRLLVIRRGCGCCIPEVVSHLLSPHKIRKTKRGLGT